MNTSIRYNIKKIDTRTTDILIIMKIKADPSMANRMIEGILKLWGSIRDANVPRFAFRSFSLSLN